MIITRIFKHSYYYKIYFLDTPFRLFFLISHHFKSIYSLVFKKIKFEHFFYELVSLECGKNYNLVLIMNSLSNIFKIQSSFSQGSTANPEFATRNCLHRSRFLLFFYYLCHFLNFLCFHSIYGKS